MTRRITANRGKLAALLAAMVLTPALRSQQPASPQVTPEVGQMAPDFNIPGATRFGLLRNPVRLSDYRGQVVVLAFIVQARTRG